MHQFVRLLLEWTEGIHLHPEKQDKETVFYQWHSSGFQIFSQSNRVFNQVKESEETNAAIPD